MGATAGDQSEVPLLAALKAAFDGDPQAVINQTEPLEPRDLAMMGTVIQLYCAADLNGRRIVDVLRHAALGEPRLASRLQDAQVFPMLDRLVGEHIGPGDLKEGLLKASHTVEMHRGHRHNFAHWVTRRVRGENALVMFTMNTKEAERRDGVALDPEEAKYGMVRLDGFDGEIRKLAGHVDYLARMAADMERRVDELRAAIAAARAP